MNVEHLIKTMIEQGNHYAAHSLLGYEHILKTIAVPIIENWAMSQNAQAAAFYPQQDWYIDDTNNNQYLCPNCGKPPKTEGFLPHYCPHCGIRTKGSDEGEE